MHTDLKAVASWCYDSATRELVSYDTVEIANIKAGYIAKNGFAGAMYWDLSADRKSGTGKAIVPNVASRLGALDKRLNHLSYPTSKFDNLRNGMKS